MKEGAIYWEWHKVTGCYNNKVMLIICWEVLINQTYSKEHKKKIIHSSIPICLFVWKDRTKVKQKQMNQVATTHVLGIHNITSSTICIVESYQEEHPPNTEVQGTREA